MSTPVQIVEKLLSNMTNDDVVASLVAPDATYVSLNHSNPDLKKIMPWCGTWQNAGPSAFINTFTGVAHFWDNEGSKTDAIFGSGENVAAFGRMTLRSKTVGIAKTVPFSVWCVVKNDKITFMQFMEDTFDTAATFRSGGAWTFRANPDTNEEFSI
ncbi:hypothetical protein MANI_010214 [Metarhizium anisopliae]